MTNSVIISLGIWIIIVVAGTLRKDTSIVVQDVEVKSPFLKVVILSFMYPIAGLLFYYSGKIAKAIGTFILSPANFIITKIWG